MDFKVIAVDFDGTLCENKWPEIGDANAILINALKEEREKNNTRIILWTCRVGQYLDEAVTWCKERGLYFDAVNDNIQEAKEIFGGDSRKIFAHVYIDDKAIGPWRWLYERIAYAD